MATIPTNPSDGDTFTDGAGTVWKYVSASNKWLVQSGAFGGSSAVEIGKGSTSGGQNTTISDTLELGGVGSGTNFTVKNGGKYFYSVSYSGPSTGGTYKLQIGGVDVFSVFFSGSNYTRTGTYTNSSGGDLTAVIIAQNPSSSGTYSISGEMIRME